MKKGFETPKVVELGTLQQIVLSGVSTYPNDPGANPHTSLMVS